MQLKFLPSTIFRETPKVIFFNLGLEAYNACDVVIHKERNINSKNSWEDLRGMGLLEVEAINYIRGRSIHHQFILFDKAQNR